MSKPLLISDCDEVLVHMISHFAAWIEESRGYEFRLEDQRFDQAIRDKATGEIVPRDSLWPLLDAFFDKEMHRQNIVPGAVEALRAIGEIADIVILTNLGDAYHANRVAQLEAFDIRHEVLCNQGGKGRPVRELVDRFSPSSIVFVDDLWIHHESVAKHAPEVWRLHMVAEPLIAGNVPQSDASHARIDRWEEAVPWVLGKFEVGLATDRVAIVAPDA
jgi:hypothetical protein